MPDASRRRSSLFALTAHLCLLILALLPAPACAQLNPTLWTSFVPFVVRSPYFSAWMNTTNKPLGGNRAPEMWPGFWPTSQPILGWAGHLRVDNNLTYKWIGDAGAPGGLQNTVLTNIQITPTRTIMNITAGPIDLTVTYLSPIEPADPVLQSLPFAYYYVTAVSNDGLSHDVQIYTDISAEWLSGDRTLSGNWQTQPTSSVVYHKTFLTTPQAYTQLSGSEQIQDAFVYLATPQSDGLSFQADKDVNCRPQFSTHGALTGVVTQGPLPINSPFTVYAFAKDLGSVTNTPTSPTVWAIGALRDPAVQYRTPNGALEQRSAFWRTSYTTDQAVITAFLADYPNAVQRADDLDKALMGNASAVSAHYADVVALAARQVMGATELTVGTAPDGSFNTSDVKMFMKDIGSSQRVNPVEVMYASFPFFLSVNASYGGWLLSPVLEFAASSAWVQPYAPADIGLNYPNATGNPAPHQMGVEQSGNMLIMTLAHARASGDGSLLAQYYPLLRNWADYLVNNTNPLTAGQLDADSISTPNSTNLAIKGIIGIKAMAQISAALQQSTDAAHYSNLAHAYASTWMSLAGSQQIVSAYGAASSSFVLPYNLFADKWLGTGLVDDATYSRETTFLQNLLGQNTNGLPASSQTTSNGNTAWTLFTAATVTDDNVRNAMIDQIWAFASKNASGSIFPTAFALDGNGGAVHNTASPGAGGVFAPLALALPNVTISAQGVPGSGSGSDGGSGGDGSGNASTKSKSNVGPIVGGVVGGIGGAALLAILGFFCWRRRRPGAQFDGEKAELDPSHPSTAAVPYTYARTDLTAATPQPSTTAVASVPVRPSKAREALGVHTQAPSQSSRSAYSTSSRGQTSSSSYLNGSRSPVSPSEVAGLRAEVENLRRVMQNFQVERVEPPPTYHEAD